ncbi:Hypothetical protein SCF082_LOCUS19288, partial [Durusdinium trenchii]
MFLSYISTQLVTFRVVGSVPREPACGFIKIRPPERNKCRWEATKRSLTSDLPTRKPQGCLNGDACLRCHLCPAGELKRRKGEQKAPGARGIEKAPREAERGEVSVEPELPSVGSKLHAAGQCKPCAWFWKADGCRNGASCGHCHMCPAGEAKARKQAKVAAIRAKGSVTGGTGETEAEPVMQPVQVMPAPVVYQAMVPQYPTLLTPWRQAGACPGCVCCTNCVPHTVPRAPCVAYFQVPPTAPVTSNCEAGDRRTLQELQSPVWAVTPVTSLPKVAPSLPSKGSALHADGRCSPCAWFWKPQGCHHGEECGRCHLCPASEIKVRRKAKAMAKDAMRAEQSDRPGHYGLREFSPASTGFETLSAQPAWRIKNQVQAAMNQVHVALADPYGDLPAGSCSLETGETGSEEEAEKGEKAIRGRFLHARLHGANARSVETPDLVTVVRRMEENGLWTDLSPVPPVPGDGDETEEGPADDRATRGVLRNFMKPNFHRVREGFVKGDTKSRMAGPLPTLVEQTQVPLASLGSILHGTGTCKPCAWFWKPQAERRAAGRAEPGHFAMGDGLPERRGVQPLPPVPGRRIQEPPASEDGGVEGGGE